MEDSLKKWLADHEINYVLHTHPPVFTVPEAKIHCAHIPGTHCKNLFLKNKGSGQFYLVTIPQEKRLDLKKFSKMINASKIRFGESEDLIELLGLTPGAVSPIGLVNDTKNRVIFIIDKDVWNAKDICCHPNNNTETLQMSGLDFRKLILATGTKVQIEELPLLEPLLSKKKNL